MFSQKASENCNIDQMKRWTLYFQEVPRKSFKLKRKLVRVRDHDSCKLMNVFQSVFAFSQTTEHAGKAPDKPTVIRTQMESRAESR